jgi:glyoxylase-like metal-dependent hydrolase (beta-lactamase superfamily II)
MSPPPPKPRKQEQEGARDEVTEVAPGVLRLELPIRMPGLGHVNCYALLDERGAAVVDPGMPGQATWRTLEARLARAGLRVRDVHTVVITHSHPDHFGGATRFVREAGARVVAHRAFRFGVSEAVQAHERPEVSVEDLAAQAAAARERAAEAAGGGKDDAAAAPGAHDHALPALEPHAHAHAARPAARGAAGRQPREPWKTGRTPWGGEPPRPSLKMRLRWRVARWLGGLSFVPQVSDPVEGGDVLRLAGRDWFVVHTPGHTEDHFCLHDPEEGVFLAGDHVLPTITPHISGLSTRADPLAAYFESLDRVAAIAPVQRVLPAHGHPFEDLAERCKAIQKHHVERLERVKAIGREVGLASVPDFSKHLFHPRNWGSMADSETYAHLEHLRLLGDAEVRRDPDGTLRYTTG